jgi:DNA helicase II / ATP-dependent DNA helicase PcrA
VKYIADLHIHSHYSRATSKASNLFGLAAWAAVKGIAVVGTGDFTHPGWFAHLHECLESAEPGFFRLKAGLEQDIRALLPTGLRPAVSPETVRFTLSAEISSIYKRGGKVRKVHNLLYVPDFDAARRLNATLATLGNIASDGRPILGLDSRNLLEILLEKAPDGFLVPAHIWTPWFSLFGSKSGFDSIEECFGDLSSHVFALETGLSSDPEMNRLISALDRFTLISNSDCHSPAKLGREANIFTTGFDYFSLREALRSPVDTAGRQAFAATVEFYPEEGKYHCDGHRKCQVCLEPHETRAIKGLCPVCSKPLTIGVLHRVMELADRDRSVFQPGSPRVHSLIPLQEIVAELLDCGATSKKAIEGYARLINLFGSEFALLLDVPVEEIRAKGSALLAEAIERVRIGRVIRQPGYDGEFGVITVFSEGERASLCGQASLFGPVATRVRQKTQARGRLTATANPQSPTAPAARELNEEQQQVMRSEAQLILVQAGPGTGKTHTLVSRVQRVASRASCPCTVITFTNKAAAEVRERLQAGVVNVSPVTVATFHGYCLIQLRRVQPELRVAGPEERAAFLLELFPDWKERERADFSRRLSVSFGQLDGAQWPPEASRYEQALLERSLIDIEAVVPRTVALLRRGGEMAAAVRSATGHLFVDEFQDVNEAQYALVSLLAQTSSVFVIGDPDQAIYGFRGADPQWFHTFIREQHPEVHQLVRNYRSGAVILRAAEQLIGHNPHPLPVEAMHPSASFTGTIHKKGCASPEREATFIADQIELHLGGTSHRSLERFDHTGETVVSFRNIGVLYRTSRQAESIAKVLAERGIPFQVVDLEAYYTKGDCRLLFSWMLLLAGLAETSDLLFLLGREQGIGAHALRTAHAWLRQPVQERGREWGDSLALTGTAGIALDRFRRLEARMRQLSQEQPVETVLRALVDYYQLDPLATDLVRLHNLALTFDRSLPAFAAHLEQFSDSVLYDERAEAVTLSTLHAAKGLEFPVVFIAGLEEGLVPLSSREGLAPAAYQKHLEEERRLLYVGITRASATLYLTWCRSRSVFGGRVEDRQASSLLAELPPAAFSPPPESRPTIQRKPAHRQLSLFS